MAFNPNNLVKVFQDGNPFADNPPDAEAYYAAICGDGRLRNPFRLTTALIAKALVLIHQVFSHENHVLCIISGDLAKIS